MDEVHRLGAPLFGRVVPIFTGVRIGLTATLERPDGMHQLFMMHVGKTFYEDRQQQLIPRVYFIHTPVKKNVNGFRQWGGNGKLNIAKIVTHLSRLDYRREFVVKLINEAYEKNRKVLTLSERKDELAALHETLGEDSGMCIGPMSQEDRLASLRKPIILATAQLVKEGLDEPLIDTLLIEYPQSSAAFSEQAAGRILRVNDVKRPPVIVVLVDSGVFVEEGNERRYPFLDKARKMQQTFKKLNYDIVKGV
jgi:superfamily II DNA or RNA helicase